MKAEDVVCVECFDSGWVAFECTGDRACGRTWPHPKHTYVEKCPCRPLNRAYQERAQRIGRAA